MQGALSKISMNRFQPDQQCRQLALRSYCSHICTVAGSHVLPIGFSTKNCQHNSNAVGSKNEVLARLAV